MSAPDQNQIPIPDDLARRAIEWLFTISMTASQLPNGSFVIGRTTMMNVDALVQESGRGRDSELLALRVEDRDYTVDPCGAA